MRRIFAAEELILLPKILVLKILFIPRSGRSSSSSQTLLRPREPGELMKVMRDSEFKNGFSTSNGYSA